MKWDDLSDEDKIEYTNLFNKLLGKTYIITNNSESLYPDDKMNFYKSEYLMNYYINYKRINIINKIKKRFYDNSKKK